MAKTKQQAEFGDFQTPTHLAEQVCNLLASQEINPASILEPTCGIGGLLFAATRKFSAFHAAFGLEINPQYARQATAALADLPVPSRVQVNVGNFFEMDWSKILAQCPSPLLIIGNPPWVTNTELSSLESENIPHKVNSQNLRGMEALTGKSNFDISEWMLQRMIEWLPGRDATLAMLCKTSVARRVLAHAWRKSLSIGNVALYGIDAPLHFDAAVDACLLVCRSKTRLSVPQANVYAALDSPEPNQTLGLRGDELVSDVAAFDRTRHLICRRTTNRRVWRSGIKHDCSKVMELERHDGLYRNKLGESLGLEEDFLFPMFKSSDIAAETLGSVRHWMLVTQQRVGADTLRIRQDAPLTWRYLLDHAEHFNARKSSIYKNRDPFAMFGIGEYAFAPWKVAISGFYKRLRFTLIGPQEGKPVVFDDTVYFLPCRTEAEARLWASCLNSTTAAEFFSCRVFWDSKRPITVDLLNRLDLDVLAHVLGRGTELEACTAEDLPGMLTAGGQSLLF